MSVNELCLTSLAAWLYAAFSPKCAFVAGPPPGWGELTAWNKMMEYNSPIALDWYSRYLNYEKTVFRLLNEAIPGDDRPFMPCVTWISGEMWYLDNLWTNFGLSWNQIMFNICPSASWPDGKREKLWNPNFDSFLSPILQSILTN